jgi:hypothetical protein
MAANIDSGGANNTASNSLQVQNGNTVLPANGGNLSRTSRTGIYGNYQDDGSGDYHLANSILRLVPGAASSLSVCAVSPGNSPCVPTLDKDGNSYANPPSVGAYE